MSDSRASEPNKYAGFLARQNHQRDPWRGIVAKCLCGKVFDLVADHAMHQVDEILRAALVAAQGAAPVPSSGVDEEFSRAKLIANGGAVGDVR